MRSYWVSVVLVVAFVSSGLGQSQNPPASSGTAVTEQANVDPKAVLGEVGDYKLTEEEFRLILSMLPGQQQALTPARKQQMVKSWLQVVAFARKAEEEKLGNDPVSEKQLDLYRLQLLAERYQKKVLSDITVTDQEVQQYYEAHKTEFGRPAQVRVSRMLLPTPEKVDQVRKALKDGVSFEELVKLHSTDGSSREKGGDIGWVRSGVTEPPFEKVVMALQPGQVSEPFQTSLGWQIAKVTDRREAEEKSLADVEKAIRNQLITTKRQQAVEATTKELFDKYGTKPNEAPKK